MAESNHTKVNRVIGKLLDQINESLDKKEAPNAGTLLALETVIKLTSLNHHLG